MHRKRKKKAPENVKSLRHVFSDFCQNTSAHGFQYWVSAGSLPERLLWITIVGCGFTFAFILVRSAMNQWFKNPSSVDIKTFSRSANEVPYPAITICNENGFDFDVGQYIRAVFDNFEYSCFKGEGHNCNKAELLRSHFPGYSEIIDKWTGVSYNNQFQRYIRMTQKFTNLLIDRAIALQNQSIPIPIKCKNMED